MLRNVLLGIGFAALIGGTYAILACGVSPGIMGVIWGALVVLGIVCERVVYKPIAVAPPGPGWRKTTERFIDEATGEPVTVYVHPETGERAYIRE